jgi:hypothetical protein
MGAKTRLAAVGFSALIVGALLLAIRRSDSSAAPAPAATETAPRRAPAGDRAVRPSAAGPEAAAPPRPIAGPRITADEKRARDGAVLEGVRAFQREAMPDLDACLGASPGPRVPRRVILTFERRPADTAGEGVDRFVAANVQVPPQRGGAALDMASPLGRCLRGLEGRPLAVAAGNAPEGDELRQVVTLFLPAPSAP